MPAPRPTRSTLTTRPARPRAARRGSVYALLLVTVAAVTGFVLVGMDLQRAQRRAARAAEDALEARVLALSALEIGLDITNRPAAWRTTQPNGVWISNLALGGGTLSLSATDPIDGNIANNGVDTLVLTGEGRVREARQRAAVTLAPAGTPHAALAYGVFTGSGLTLTAGAIAGTAPVHSNAFATATGAMVTTAVSASGAITGGTFTGTARAAQPVVTPPDAALIADYVALATSIPYAATISGALLAPGVNTLGTASPRGIYVIDCANRAITIRDVRLVGTLILLEPGANSKLDRGLIAEPGTDNYPVLLVRGSIEIATTGANVSEATLGVNLNPAGLALGGSANTTAADTFPSAARGIVFCTGDCTVSGTLNLTGSLIARGEVKVGGTLVTALDPANTTAPPPCFQAAARMRVVPGSWRFITD